MKTKISLAAKLLAVVIGLNGLFFLIWVAELTWKSSWVMSMNAALNLFLHVIAGVCAVFSALFVFQGRRAGLPLGVIYALFHSVNFRVNDVWYGTTMGIKFYYSWVTGSTLVVFNLLAVAIVVCYVYEYKISKQIPQ